MGTTPLWDFFNCLGRPLQCFGSSWEMDLKNIPDIVRNVTLLKWVGHLLVKWPIDPKATSWSTNTETIFIEVGHKKEPCKPDCAVFPSPPPSYTLVNLGGICLSCFQMLSQSSELKKIPSPFCLSNDSCTSPSRSASLLSTSISFPTYILLTCFLTHGSHSDQGPKSPSWQLIGHVCWLQALDSWVVQTCAQKFFR